MKHLLLLVDSFQYFKLYKEKQPLGACLVI